MKRMYHRGLRKKTIKNKAKSNSPEKGVNFRQEGKWRKIEIRYSLLAVIVSFLGLFWTLYQDYQSNKEEIIINSFEPAIDSKIFFQEVLQSDRLITLEYGILLSNTSDKTISIIGYKLEQIAKDLPEKGFYYPVYYSGLNQGFMEPDGKPASIPFIIKSGESKLIYIRTGIIINKNTFSKINEAYKLENGVDISPEMEFTFEELTYYTVKAQTDIYGNKIDGTAFKDPYGRVTYSYSSSLEIKELVYPVFSLTFKTASRNYFNHLYHDYVINDF